jgi:hypothetical protein
MGWLRRRRLPTGRRPPLAADERVLAWAAGEGDDVVVATNHGVWLPGATRALGWHEIHKATWSGRELTLVPAREVGQGDGYVVVADQAPVSHRLLDPDNVPEQVRTRVTRSIAYTAHHPVPGGGVRVVARRVPGVNGLRWTVRYDGGAEPDGEAVRAATAELVEQARAGVGVPAL